MSENAPEPEHDLFLPHHKVYLVGGAVRDLLLGIPPGDRDFCVVGATPDEMLKLGFTPVGKHFPVFLHPSTKEAYALARMERKTAPGHQGFQFEFSPRVTLEEDLARRDFTINAMALRVLPNQQQGWVQNLIDPYGGKQDIQNKVLRPVSSSFREDPLRVLRAARFTAQLPGFQLSPSAWKLLSEMTTSLSELSQTRIREEFAKALAQKNPLPFFEMMWQLPQNFFHYFKSANMNFCKSLAGLSFEEQLGLLTYQNPHKDEILEVFTLGTHSLEFINKVHQNNILEISPTEAFLQWLQQMGALQTGNHFERYLLLRGVIENKNFNPYLKIKRELKSIKIQDLHGPAAQQALFQARLSALKNLVSYSECEED